MTCIRENCTNEIYAKHICQKHYDEVRRRAKGVRPKPVKGAHTCTTPGCDRGVYAKGLCTRHYDQARARAAEVPERPTEKEICSENGCGNFVHSKHLCQNHYRTAVRRAKGIGSKPGRKAYALGGKCNQGHLLTPENVCMEGSRVRCRTCDDGRNKVESAFRSRIIRELLAARQGWLCSWCGEAIPEDLLLVDVDHIIPRIIGGPTAEWNLDLLHSSCNHLKAAKITSKAIALAEERGLSELLGRLQEARK